MVDLYTVDAVDKIVVDGSDDLDEHIDFYAAVVSLPPDQMIYLSERFAGYSAGEALSTAGIATNSTRFHADAVRALTRVLNGVTSGT